MPNFLHAVLMAPWHSFTCKTGLLKKSFFAKAFASVFDRVIAIEALAVSLQRRSESHFTTGHGFVSGGAFPFLLLKVAQAQLGDTDSIRLERFPNELAAHAESSIVIARWYVAHEIGHGRFLPAR